MTLAGLAYTLSNRTLCSGNNIHAFRANEANMYIAFFLHQLWCIEHSTDLCSLGEIITRMQTASSLTNVVKQTRFILGFGGGGGGGGGGCNH